MSDNRINSNTSPMHQYWKDKFDENKTEKVKATEVFATVIQNSSPKPQTKIQTTPSNVEKGEQIRKPLPPIPQSYGNKGRSKSVSNVNSQQKAKISLSSISVGSEYNIAKDQLKTSPSSEGFSTPKRAATPQLLIEKNNRDNQPVTTVSSQSIGSGYNIEINRFITPPPIDFSSTPHTATSQPKERNKKGGTFTNTLKKIVQGKKEESAEPIKKIEEAEVSKTPELAKRKTPPFVDAKSQVDNKYSAVQAEIKNNEEYLKKLLDIVASNKDNHNERLTFVNTAKLSNYANKSSALLKELHTELQTAFNSVQDEKYTNLINQKNRLAREISGRILEFVMVVEKLIQLLESETCVVTIYEQGEKKEIDKREILKVFKSFTSEWGLMFRNRLNNLEKDCYSEKEIGQAFKALGNYFKSLQNLIFTYSTSFCKSGVVDVLVNICQKKNSEACTIKFKNHKNEEVEEVASTLFNGLNGEIAKYMSLFEKLAESSKDLLAIHDQMNCSLFCETQVVQESIETVLLLKSLQAEIDFKKSITLKDQLVKELSGKIIEFLTIVEKLIQVLEKESTIIIDIDTDKKTQNEVDKTKILNALKSVSEKKAYLNERLLKFEEDLFSDDKKTKETIDSLRGYLELLQTLTITYIQSFYKTDKALTLNVCKKGSAEPILIDYTNRRKEPIKRQAVELLTAIPREISQYMTLFKELKQCVLTISEANKILMKLPTELEVHEEFRKLKKYVKSLQKNINERNSIWVK